MERRGVEEGRRGGNYEWRGEQGVAEVRRGGKEERM